jgi:hypothetical protein
MDDQVRAAWTAALWIRKRGATQQLGNSQAREMEISSRNVIPHEIVS